MKSSRFFPRFSVKKPGYKAKECLAESICPTLGIASINEDESFLPLCASLFTGSPTLRNYKPFNVKFVALNPNIHVRLLKSISCLTQSHKWWSCF